MEILCFFAGTLFVYVNHVYPLLFLGGVLFFRCRFIFLVSFVLAIGFAHFHQWWSADQGMPDEAVVHEAKLIGKVASIPLIAKHKTQFQFQLESLNDELVKSTLLLTCYRNCPRFQGGEHWKIKAKLKKARSLLNPGSFDYARLLHANHVDWTGVVKSATLQKNHVKRNTVSLLVFRQNLANKLAHYDPDETSLGILQALSLGISNQIDKSDWELFRRTGTIHLMVISGAHIGLVAGFVYSFVCWFWSRMGRASLYVPAPKVASFIALFFAFLYTLLSGFAVPAQRALIVCFFMLAKNFLNQTVTAWQAWRYALLTVILFEPRSVMLSGFYLSFAAVAILLIASQRFKFVGIRQMIVLQLSCLLGLMPLTLYWFSYGATNGLIANLLAIPWVGFVVVPLALLISISAWFFNPKFLLLLFKGSVSILLSFLHCIDAFSLFNIHASFVHIIQPLLLMAILLVITLLPLKPFIIAGILIFVVTLFPSHSRPNYGDARVDLLDVGQGLSVVVRTAKHVLVYDTGAKFFNSTDMGKQVLIPYLQVMGIKSLDAVVISHPDNDHRGGLESLSESHGISQFLVDDPSFYDAGESCHDYPAWQWDGVEFRFFPISENLPRKNNHSCVLKIMTKSAQVLLTGDIEKVAETYLVEHYGSQLHSSVLLIPHHASKTSSSKAFLEAVNPQQAIVSYAVDNQYHFPHAEAKQAYKSHHIPVYSTADCGMVEVNVKAKQSKVNINCYKE